MNKIIATIGCSISGAICFLAAWKLCEADKWPWGVFAFLGFIILVMGNGPYTKNNE